MTPRAVLVLVALAIVAACGPLGAPAHAVYTGNPLCVSGGVTIQSQDYIPPEGGDWREFPRTAWACAGGGATSDGEVVVGVSLSDGTDRACGACQEILRPGTLVRVRLTLPDTMDAPLTVTGWASDLDADWSDRAVTVIGRVTRMRLGSQDVPGRSCEDPVSYWSVRIRTRFAPLRDTAFFKGIDTVALQANNFGGMVFGTTTGTLAMPYVGSNKLTLNVSGCGDGDPATIDGGVNGFIPLTTIARLGLPMDTVRQAPTQAIAAMMAVYKDDKTRQAMLDPTTGVPVVDINGKPLTQAVPVPDLTVPFTLVTRHGVEGLQFALGLSLSSHTLDVAPNRGNLGAVQRCAAVGVPVSYSGSGSATKVVCSVPLPKAPSALHLSKDRLRPTRVTARFTARRGQRYVITAADDHRSAKGRCSVNGTRGTCTVVAPNPGTWTVSVTARRGVTSGVPVGKTMRLV